MKRRKNRGGTVWKSLVKAADLPAFSAGADETIEIAGGNTVLIEGVLAIHTYEPETVRLQMKGYRLALTGRDFDLVRFGSASFQITGKLKKIEWED